MSSKSFVFKMKCQVTSDTTHSVLISKEISYKTYKEICIGEPIKVNMGFNYERSWFQVENNSLIHIPREAPYYIKGKRSAMSYDWEILSKFFLTHNIEPNWLHCNFSAGHYDDELGGWTGCVGKV